MKSRAAAIGKSVLRWGIAVLGIAYVISLITWSDRVYVLNPATNLPQEMTLAEHVEDDAAAFPVQGGQPVPRAQVVNSATGNGKTIKLKSADGTVGPEVPLAALDLSFGDNRKARVERLLVQKDGRGVWLTPAEVTDFHLKVPNPRVQIGVKTLLSRANPWLLVASLAVFPVTFIVTTFRWHRLLAGLDIHLPLGRVFILNVVGNFYNTFMPAGSTGGDLLKAWYASRQTPHRTSAVMSVIIDRIIGLLALVLMGGTMAAVMWLRGNPATDPTARMCRYVALMSAAIFLGSAVGAGVLASSRIRRGLGLSKLIKKLPKQDFIEKIVHVGRQYKRRPGLIVWAILITLPVHLAVVVAAMFAGKAFGLPISNGYYFVIVPVVVLVGAIPISPQGAGVMEYFAFQLISRQGGNVAHALVLTMSIRLIHIIWNLSGGIFVLRGGYHAPSEKEQAELEQSTDNDAVAEPPVSRDAAGA